MVYPSIDFKRLVRVKHNPEPNLKCQLLLILMGFAYVVDGIVMMLSLGFVSGGLGLETAKQLSFARHAERARKGTEQ